MRGIEDDTAILPYPPSLRRSATSPASYDNEKHVARLQFLHAIVELIARLPFGPLEISALGMEPCDFATSAVEARLVIPSIIALAITRVPARVHADRPLEIELAAVGFGAVNGAVEYVASWVSTHALLAIVFEVPGQPRREVSVFVKARPFGGGWTARALVRPSAWADVVSVTVVSLSLAGRPLPCDCLPETLQVGYNHSPAPVGAVYDAVRIGDVAALQATLDAGGSTEEVNEVRLL